MSTQFFPLKIRNTFPQRFQTRDALDSIIICMISLAPCMYFFLWAWVLKTSVVVQESNPCQPSFFYHNLWSPCGLFCLFFAFSLNIENLWMLKKKNNNNNNGERKMGRKGNMRFNLLVQNSSLFYTPSVRSLVRDSYSNRTSTKKRRKRKRKKLMKL